MKKSRIKVTPESVCPEQARRVARSASKGRRVKKSEKYLTGILLYDIFKIEDVTKGFENKKGGSMKKYVVLFLGLVLFFAASGLALAQEGGEFFYSDQEMAGRFNLGVRGGGAFPCMKGDYVYTYPDATTQTLSVKGKNGWFAGGELTYDLGDYLAVGVEGYYEQYKVKVTRAFHEIGADGDLGTAKNGMAFAKFILKYGFDVGDYTFTPYVAGAPGGIFPDFKESDVAENNNLSIETQSGFAAKYSAGFDLRVTDNIAINIEGAYLDVDIKTAVRPGNHGTAKNDIKNDAWMAGGGLKYIF